MMQCCPKCQEGIGRSVSPGPCAICGYRLGVPGSENTAAVKRAYEARRKRHLAWRRRVEAVFRDFGYSMREFNSSAEKIEEVIFGRLKDE